MICHKTQPTLNKLQLLISFLILVTKKTCWTDFTWVSQKFCNILLTYLLYSASYNKSNLASKVEAIMLYHLKPPFFQFFDPMQIPNPSRQRTISLKLPSSLGCWSIANAQSKLWIRSNILREPCPDYMVCEHLFASSCSLRLKSPLLNLPPPLGCWTVTSTWSDPWIGTSNI